MKRLQAVFNIQISQRGCPVRRKSTNHLSGGTAGTDAVGTIPSTDEMNRVDYCGNMVYDRGERKLLLRNGYVTFDLLTNTPSYHFYLCDHLGNNRVVMAHDGTVEQVTHYYPFGGVMRESTNPGLQPYKYGGKELDRTSGLDAYDFGARMYFADRLQWGQMDPFCEKYYDWSPYSYCVNRPVNAFDPNGMDVFITGEFSSMALEQLQEKVGKSITLFLDENNKLSYKIKHKRLTKKAEKLAEIIDNSTVTVFLKTTNLFLTSEGDLLAGGSFMGNDVTLDNDNNVTHVYAFQEINPEFFEKADKYYGKGSFCLHELTEAYEGALISMKKKKSSPKASKEGSVYEEAHKRATYQPPMREELLNSLGKRVIDSSEASSAKWYIFNPHIQQFEPIQTFP